MNTTPINSFNTTLVAPHQAATQSGESQSSSTAASSLTSSAGKGFIGTIVGGVKSAAQAVANFVVAAFKKVFCCFFGDSKEVKLLKGQQETLQLLRGMLDSAVETGLDTQAKKAFAEEIKKLPQDLQNELVKGAMNQILNIDNQEPKAKERAEAMVFKMTDYGHMESSGFVLDLPAMGVVPGLITAELKRVEGQLAQIK